MRSSTSRTKATWEPERVDRPTTWTPSSRAAPAIRTGVRSKTWHLPKTFKGYPVAFRPTLQEGLWNVFFMTHKIGQIDLRQL
jgi:hypothetical protein